MATTDLVDARIHRQFSVDGSDTVSHTDIPAELALAHIASFLEGQVHYGHRVTASSPDGLEGWEIAITGVMPQDFRTFHAIYTVPARVL